MLIQKIAKNQNLRLVLYVHLFALLVLPAAFASAETDKKGKEVLSPDRFEYPMKMGYSAAQKHPDVIKKLFCYCGCDKAENHQSLMDCYVSTHGAYCEICLEEAIKADEMCGKKCTVREIQKQVDNDFSKLYPLPAPTPALLKYRDELKKEGLPLTDLSKKGIKPAGTPGKCCSDHSNSKK